MSDTEKPKNIKNLKILIVDSNVFIAKTLYSILEAFGVRKIMLSHTLDEAEKMYYSTEIDCVFVDFMMENRTGIEFIKTLRTKPGEKNDQKLPIILNTGLTDRDTIFMARDVGVTEVISKPFSPDQVLSKLENAVNNPRAFIEIDEFVGPDRRRRRPNKKEWSGENDRRSYSAKRTANNWN